MQILQRQAQGIGFALLLVIVVCSDHNCNNPDPTSPDHIHSGCASPYAAPPVLTTALNLRWMLLFEDPVDRSLWFGKAVPRQWWIAGETIGLEDAPTRYGAAK